MRYVDTSGMKSGLAANRRTSLLARCASMVLGGMCIAGLAAAQSLPNRATYLEGGIVTWPWVWQDPQNPGEYAAWTVEDGARIRFARFTSASAPQPSTPWSWVSPHAPRNLILRAISVADDGMAGMAVGDDATWLWATDSVTGGVSGGGAWKSATVNLPSSFTTIPDFWHVFQNTTAPAEAWVVGESGLLAWTPNGVGLVVDLFACNFVTPAGAPHTLPIGELTGIAFTTDMSAGAAVGDLLTTTTSGPNPTTFVQGGIYYTTNGQDWHQSTLIFRNPSGTTVNAPLELRFWKVAFVPNSMTGFAVGGVESEVGYLMTTFDGGATWEEEHHQCRGLPALSCGPLNAICPPQTAQCESFPAALTEGRGKTLSQYGVSTFADGSALSVGYGGQILRRDPLVSGTRKWIDVTNRCDFTSQPLWGVHNSPDGQLSVLTGAPGQVRASADGGASWANLGTEGAWRSQAIEVVATGGDSSGEVVWTCGQASRICVSVDRGATFSTQRAENVGERKNQHLLAIAMRDDGDDLLSNDRGVAVGRLWNPGGVPSWTILHTSSGGEAPNSSTCGWNESTVIDPVGVAPTDLLAAAYAGDLQGGAASFWCAGYDNTVLRSYDGGVTWKLNGPCSLSTGGGCTPQVGNVTDWVALSFASVDEGWLSGFDYNANAPVVFRTTDAGGPNGATWSQVLPALHEMLVDLHSRGGATFGVTAVGDLYRWNSSTLAFDAMPASPYSTPEFSDVEVTLDASSGVHVYVAGANGVLGRFNNATGAWSQLKSESSFTAGGLAFVSAELGYQLFDQDSDPEDGGSARVITRID
jgi:hypothetical protein